MKENLIQVICGPGKGKTASALGRGVTALLKGKTVIMVQFLKGSMETEGMEIVKRLEPEFKLFRFEKSPIFFDQLSEEEKDEARINIRNGLNFAKKVLVTVIQVDGELPKEQIREDAKPLEELTFTSALPFLLCDPEIFQEYIAIRTLCWIRGRVLRVSNINRLENKRRRTEHGNF